MDRLLRTDEHVAETEHECVSCDTPIEPGQKYIVAVDIVNGKFGVEKCHKPEECPGIDLSEMKNQSEP